MATPLWRNRDFQLLWAGQAVSGIGSRASSVAYPLLVLAMTGSPATAGIVGFVGALPYILFQLPAGALVDRVNRRRLMIGCDVGRTLALGSIPLAFWLGRLTIAQVFVVAFIEGTLFVLFRLGEVSAVRMVVPKEHFSTALAQNEARFRAATLVGNSVGGILFDLGRALPFLADALSYLLSVGTLVLIRRRFEEVRTAVHRHVLAEIREGFEWLLDHRYVLVVNLAAAATNAFFQIVGLVVIVAERQRDASATQIGLILAGFGAGGLLGAVAGGWLTRRFKANTIVLLALWLWAAVTPLAGVVNSAPALFLLLGSIAFLGASWNIAAQAIYFRLIPDRLIGRVSSVGSLAAFGALPLGQLGGGLLVQAYGPLIGGLVAGGGMIFVAVLTTAAPSVRRGPELAG